MIRLQVMSDLHLNYYRGGPKLKRSPEADAVVIAGDASDGPCGAMAYGNAVFVPGNHDYYGAPHEESDYVDRFLTQITGADGSSVRLVCCTLWTDFMLFGRPAHSMGLAESLMSDYREIRGFGPGRALELHRAHREFLERHVQLGDVVVTHHAPSIASIGDNYAGHRLNPAFASDLESFILERQPAVWIHGHTHSARDYTIGATRIVCNPRGYPEERTGFNPNLVIEVP